MNTVAVGLIELIADSLYKEASNSGKRDHRTFSEKGVLGTDFRVNYQVPA
jgi:hypothetical protein